MTFTERSQLSEFLLANRAHQKSAISYFIGQRRRLPFTGSTRQLMNQLSHGTVETRMTHPWDRRIDESAKSYEYFCHYRDSGSDRTLKGTAEACGTNSNSQIQLMKRKYEWMVRVRAYDEWEEKRLRKVAERQKKEMVERQARLGMTMTLTAQGALESGVIRPETVADVVRLADSGTRIERLARGESTENVATGMRLILAHPLPPWAPEAAKALVDESVYDEVEGAVIEDGGGVEVEVHEVDKEVINADGLGVETEA